MKVMSFRTISEATIRKGTRVIIRADFDVAIKSGKIQDEFRIRKVMPTVRYVLKRSGKVRLIAHLGRPKGKINQALSLKPIAGLLGKILQKNIILISDPFDPKAFRKYDDSPEILLFENLRFWRGEEENSSPFAENLACWADMYVNEAFASSHRAHASMVGLPKLLSSYAGLQLASEIKHLEFLSRKAQRPLVVVIGGIKLETKLPLVKRFLKEADQILVGGGVANSIFHAMGMETGRSKTDFLRDKSILRSKKLCFPLDVITTTSLTSRSGRVTKIEKTQKDEYIVDIGPETIRLFSSLVKNARSIFWNGPLGFTPNFSNGTNQLARTLARSSAFKVIGGGDTLAALKRLKLPLKFFGHVSTGGGSMLEMLAGEKLPGIEILKR